MDNLLLMINKTITETQDLLKDTAEDSIHIVYSEIIQNISEKDPDPTEFSEDSLLKLEEVVVSNCQTDNHIFNSNVDNLTEKECSTVRDVNMQDTVEISQSVNESNSDFKQIDSTTSACESKKNVNGSDFQVTTFQMIDFKKYRRSFKNPLEKRASYAPVFMVVDLPEPSQLYKHPCKKPKYKSSSFNFAFTEYEYYITVQVGNSIEPLDSFSGEDCIELQDAQTCKELKMEYNKLVYASTNCFLSPHRTVAVVKKSTENAPVKKSNKNGPVKKTNRNGLKTMDKSLKTSPAVLQEINPNAPTHALSMSKRSLKNRKTEESASKNIILLGATMNLETAKYENDLKLKFGNEVVLNTSNIKPDTNLSISTAPNLDSNDIKKFPSNFENRLDPGSTQENRDSEDCNNTSHIINLENSSCTMTIIKTENLDVSTGKPADATLKHSPNSVASADSLNSCSNTSAVYNGLPNNSQSATETNKDKPKPLLELPKISSEIGIRYMLNQTGQYLPISRSNNGSDSPSANFQDEFSHDQHLNNANCTITSVTPMDLDDTDEFETEFYENRIVNELESIPNSVSPAFDGESLLPLNLERFIDLNGDNQKNTDFGDNLENDFENYSDNKCIENNKGLFEFPTENVPSENKSEDNTNSAITSVILIDLDDTDEFDREFSENLSAHELENMPHCVSLAFDHKSLLPLNLERFIGLDCDHQKSIDIGDNLKNNFENDSDNKCFENNKVLFESPTENKSDDKTELNQNRNLCDINIVNRPSVSFASNLNSAHTPKERHSISNNEIRPENLSTLIDTELSSFVVLNSIGNNDQVNNNNNKRENYLEKCSDDKYAKNNDTVLFQCITKKKSKKVKRKNKSSRKTKSSQNSKSLGFNFFNNQQFISVPISPGLNNGPMKPKQPLSVHNKHNESENPPVFAQLSHNNANFGNNLQKKKPHKSNVQLFYDLRKMTKRLEKLNRNKNSLAPKLKDKPQNSNQNKNSLAPKLKKPQNSNQNKNSLAQKVKNPTNLNQNKNSLAPKLKNPTNSNQNKNYLAPKLKNPTNSNQNKNSLALKLKNKSKRSNRNKNSSSNFSAPKCSLGPFAIVITEPKHSTALANTATNNQKNINFGSNFEIDANKYLHSKCIENDNAVPFQPVTKNESEKVEPENKSPDKAESSQNSKCFNSNLFTDPPYVPISPGLNSTPMKPKQSLLVNNRQDQSQNPPVFTQLCQKSTNFGNNLDKIKKHFNSSVPLLKTLVKKELEMAKLKNKSKNPNQNKNSWAAVGSPKHSSGYNRGSKSQNLFACVITGSEHSIALDNTATNNQKNIKFGSNLETDVEKYSENKFIEQNSVPSTSLANKNQFEKSESVNQTQADGCKNSCPISVPSVVSIPSSSNRPNSNAETKRKRHLSSDDKENQPLKKSKQSENPPVPSAAVLSRREQDIINAFIDANEIADNHDPRWKLYSFSDPWECFKAVINQWSYGTLPNPHEDLTRRYHSQPMVNGHTYKICGNKNVMIKSIFLYSREMDIINNQIDNLQRQLDQFGSTWTKRQVTVAMQKLDILYARHKKYHDCLQEAKRFYVYFKTSYFDASHMTEIQKNEALHSRDILNFLKDYYGTIE